VTEAARHRRDLFMAALDVPSAERPAFLRRECHDAALCTEILELLAIDPPETFLLPPDLRTDSRLRPVFGPYEVEATADLGPGRHLARHATAGHTVEIVVQPLPSAIADDRVTAFVRTAHRINQLRHSGCVAVHEHGRMATGFWFARDHVAGHDLACELERQRGPGAARAVESLILPHIGSREWAQSLLAVFETVVDVLHEAHRIGISHGDLTAARILLDREGRGHVADFGVAALLDKPASPTLDLAAVCRLLSTALADALAPPADGHTHAATPTERANLRELVRRADVAGQRPYTEAAALLADLRRVRRGQPPAPCGWPERLVGWFAARRLHRSADRGLSGR